MHDLVQFALLGLGAGAVYTLLAQGTVLIYRASGVVNFAQGALAMTGAYTYVELRKHHWSFAPAMLVAALLCALIGVVVYQAVMRPLRTASGLTRVIATLGILTVLQAAAVLRYKSNLVSLLPSLPHGVVHISSVTVPADRLWLVAIAAALTAALDAISRFTSVGRATAAVAENETAAAALGWSPDLIATANWALGGAVAAVAGILVMPLTGLNVTILVLLVVPALAAALVGGFTSFPLTLAGGLLIGVLQSEMGRYVKAPGWPQAIPFLAIIVVLVVRGKGLPLRGYLSERLPELGTGRPRPVAVAVIAVVVALLIATAFPADWVADITVSLVFAIMLLSVVVLTGYAGQLSLAQFALGGIGALLTAQLVHHGWPFEPALILGVIGTTVVGLVFAIPALRTRGVNLAVVTLGMGFAAQAVIFNNPRYIGGPSGTAVGAQTFLGVSIDFIRSPEHYALFTLLCLLATAAMVCNLRRSRAGRRLIAVRTNERAAASLGVSVFGSKLYAFAVSAAIAGLAGALYAFRNYTIVYSDFEPFHSITVVTLAVVGGAGFVIGASFGATLAAGGIGVIVANAIAGNNSDEWLTLVGGVFLLTLLMQDPNGMASHNTRQFVRLVDRLRSRWARLPAVTRLPDVPRHRVKPATLTVEEVTVRFGGVVALDNVGLSVRAGEVVGLIGPNGAGKTTLIDVVTGFVRPVAGRVLVDQTRIEGWAPYRRARAGVTRSFQSLELFDDVTVLDNLRAASDGRQRLAYLTDLVWPTKPPLPAPAVAAVREFGLEPDLDRRPNQLSHGRRRLVAIARAVATQPSILLLDEPAAGLGDAESAELAALVRRLADEWGLGILLIEHNMSVVMPICDRITVLDFGRKIAEGTPEQVRRDPAVVAAYLGEDTGSEQSDVSILQPGGQTRVPSSTS